jgi:hypothetical protein
MCAHLILNIYCQQAACVDMQQLHYVPKVHVWVISDLGHLYWAACCLHALLVAAGQIHTAATAHRHHLAALSAFMHACMLLPLCSVVFLNAAMAVIEATLQYSSPVLYCDEQDRSKCRVQAQLLHLSLTGQA